MGPAVIACDLETGGAKSAVIDEDGRVLADRVVGYKPCIRRWGYQQRPDDWFRAVAERLRALTALPEVQTDDIQAIALSGHSLGCVPVDAKVAMCKSTPIWSDGQAGEDHWLLRAVRLPRLVSRHRQRISCAALHAVQTSLAEAASPGELRGDAHYFRHQGLCEFSSDRPAGYRPFLCVGRQRLRSRGAALFGRAPRGGKS